MSIQAIAGSVCGLAGTPAQNTARPAAAQRDAAPEPAVPVRDVGMRDTYTPAPQAEPQTAGVYRVTRGADGSRRIEFDSPARGAEQCTANTDRVDRELARLREQKQQLEQQLRAADPQKADDLRRRLAQLERELLQKDNDAYRRQHTVFR